MLANPARMEQYNGIKHADDTHDAFFLAELLRLTQSIEQIEKVALRCVKELPYYSKLTTLPGVGRILGMTIALEVGDIGRSPSNSRRYKPVSVQWRYWQPLALAALGHVAGHISRRR